MGILDQLKSEVAAVVPVPVASLEVPAPFKEAIEKLEAGPHGMPKLVGESAALYSALLGGSETEYAGRGQFAKLVCTSVAELIAVAGSVQHVVPVLPPDAPTSLVTEKFPTVEIGQVPVELLERIDALGTPAPASGTVAAALESTRADVVETTAAATIEAPAEYEAMVTAAVTEPSRKRGRPKKLETAPVTDTTAPAEVETVAPATVKRQLFIGCEPNIECTLLRPYLVAFARKNNLPIEACIKFLAEANLPAGAYYIGKGDVIDHNAWVYSGVFDLVVVPS